MMVRDLMTPEFEEIRSGASLLEAMRHLQDRPVVEDEIGIKCVVVVDGEHCLRGVLTQSDVVGEILFPYFARDLATTTERTREFLPEDFANLGMWAARVSVRSVMTTDPITIAPDRNAFEAADMLITHKVKSLPVVEDGKVLGILYRSALYRSIAGRVLAEAPKD